MPAKKYPQGKVKTGPSRDACTAGAQGHVSSDNVSGRRAGLNDDKKKPMREGTFTTDAEKDQSELFKDELRNQVSNLERRLQQLEVERVRNEKEQENRRLEEQRVRMQLEYEEEKKKIKAREEELNNRERHLQQLEKERVRKEEREKHRLEEQRVSMQLEYEEAQKKIKAREAEVLKRQEDERKKEAEQKRREADDEKSRKQQEQMERKRRELEQGLKPYTASSEGASWNSAGNLHYRESTEKQDYHNEKPEWLKLQSTRSVQGNPDKVFTVQWKSTINVKIQSDTSQCHITAICVLPDGQVLVADCSNKKVKLLDQQYQVFSHCGVTNQVLDMCLITPSEVAVAVYDDSKKHEVQFITVTQSKLVSGRKFRLQHECRGIAHYQGDLFICSGEALFKYTLSGKQVCRLYEGISVWKCAVSPTGDRLYITSYWQHKLLTLARDGTLLATYTDPALEWPRGLHVTPAGQVLVCGYWSDTVQQVGWEGQSKLANLATHEDGQLLNTEDNGVVKGSAKSKSSDVRVTQPFHVLVLQHEGHFS
ncbi:uncharacterized protein LOC127870111 [Dreissena polymorpha]|uniref:uncharacterized protein LOC127870111 n=1 Tax=Dreissena polymorpha TaxID=45954 RepID=UPI00226481AF|nr:uncharacterized protein LOC127870111 [Dreissena polymorpha]